VARQRLYSEPFEMVTFIGIILKKIVSTSQKTPCQHFTDQYVFFMFGEGGDNQCSL
jgi:hypothetical protein